MAERNLERRARRSRQEHTTGKASKGFTAEERAAMKDASRS